MPFINSLKDKGLSKIIIAGESGNHCLETSFYEAFRELGHEVVLFDTKKAVQKYARPGKWGYKFHTFVPVDAWVKKANKDFVNVVKGIQPDLLVAFTGAEILPGTFAYIKTLFPVRIAWYWADPLLNLNRYILDSLPLTDMVASYSRNTLHVFEQMGVKKAAWLPFAGDKLAHYSPAAQRGSYEHDVSFIGSWRPEREEVLKNIHILFPHLRLKISGPYWQRCAYSPLKKLADSRPLFGKAFSSVVQRSFLNLNVMDDLNYPGVNMRFFEIPMAGGLELCSAAPEMENVFADREHLLYFSGKDRLAEQIEYAFAHKEEIERIKLNGQALLMQEHLYTHRASMLLNWLGGKA